MLNRHVWGSLLARAHSFARNPAAHRSLPHAPGSQALRRRAHGRSCRLLQIGRAPNQLFLILHSLDRESLRHAIADRWAREPELREGQWLETPFGKSQFDFLHMAIPVNRLLDFRDHAFACMQKHDIFLCEEGVWIWPECYAVVLYGKQTRDNDATRLMHQATEEMYRLAQDVGGSIEYVHGVGVRLGHLMERELGGGMYVLRALKNTCDPDGIMNPGKLGLG